MGYTLARLALVLALAAAFGGAGFRGARRSKRLGAALAAAGLAFVLFQYADPRWDLDKLAPLPVGLWRDALYAPSALLPGVALALAKKEKRERILTLLLVILFCVFVLSDPLFVLATGSTGGTQVKDGVVLQRNDRNCVPASAATVLRLWGHEVDEGAFAFRCQTSHYGTPTHRVLDAIRAEGFEAARFQTTWDELRVLDHPCLLHVKLNGVQAHSIALLGLTRERIVVGDPLVGRQSMEPRLFASWKPWAGEAIVIGRDFQHDVAPGARHRIVRELRATLGAPGADLLDADLARRVEAFQRERGLAVTSRLEPRTILALQAIARRGQAPRLSP